MNAFKTYKEAYDYAVEFGNRVKSDTGIEKNFFKEYVVCLLPPEEISFGFQLRIERVKCPDAKPFVRKKMKPKREEAFLKNLVKYEEMFGIKR